MPLTHDPGFPQEIISLVQTFNRGREEERKAIVAMIATAIDRIESGNATEFGDDLFTLKNLRDAISNLAHTGAGEMRLTEAARCPVCNARPDIGRCEPWRAAYGPQPWYAAHYSLEPVEHTFGANGDTREQAVVAWNSEVAAGRAALSTSTEKEAG